MNVKKIAIIGAISLVVIGCVLAAGCTSNQSTIPATSTNTIVGAWIAPYDNGNGMVGKDVEVFNADGIGYYIIYEDAGFTHLLKNGQLTWKKNDNGTYERTSNESVQTVIHNAETDTYTDFKYPSAVKTRMDPVTGIWAGAGTAPSGKPSINTHVLLNDGTGYHFHTLGDGTITAGKNTWTRNSDGTYVLKFSDSVESTWKLNAAGNEITSSSGNSFKKYFADSYYYLSYLGKWVGKDSDSTVILCGDGTGLRINGTTGDIATFSWSIPEFGKLTCHFQSGNSSLTGEPLAGTETTYTYDRANDIFVNDFTGYRYGHDLIWNKA